MNAVITACRIRLRPILMTSRATIIGMEPMALKFGRGSEQYAPLARVIPVCADVRIYVDDQHVICLESCSPPTYSRSSHG
jgi:hypothetical protein